MAKWGKCSFDGLKDLQKKLERIEQEELSRFMEDCAKDLARRLLTMVIMRTPVGDRPEYDGDTEEDREWYDKYWGGYTGGTLRRGWTAQTHEEAAAGEGKPTAAEILEYADGLKISRMGSVYTIEIVNPVEYASYVEYGHRQQKGRYVPAIGKRLVKNWQPGRLMLTTSEKSIKGMAPKLLEKKLTKWLEEVFA